MRTWNFMQWCIALIIVAGCVAIVLIALPAMGIVIPHWVVQIFWVVVICFVAICAIGLLVKMWQSWKD